MSVAPSRLRATARGARAGPRRLTGWRTSGVYTRVRQRVAHERRCAGLRERWRSKPRMGHPPTDQASAASAAAANNGDDRRRARRRACGSSARARVRRRPERGVDQVLRHRSSSVSLPSASMPAPAVATPALPRKASSPSRRASAQPLAVEAAGPRITSFRSSVIVSGYRYFINLPRAGGPRARHRARAIRAAARARDSRDIVPAGTPTTLATCS